MQVWSNPTPYALGLSLGLYVLGAFSGMAGEALWEGFTPFKHFDPPTLVQQRAFNPGFLALDFLFIAGALALAYRRFLRRDIPTVA